MRRAVLTLLSMAGVATPLAAQTGPAAELLERCERNETEFLALVSGLSAAQWTFEAAPDRWSIAEVAEHIVLADRWVLGVLTGELRDVDPSDAERTRAEAVEGQITSALRDRSQKFQAPDRLQPEGRFGQGPGILEAFRETRAGLEAFVRAVDFDMRARVAPNPNLGADMDAHVWVVLAVEHTARHMEQIREVMRAEGFPGGLYDRLVGTLPAPLNLDFETETGDS